MRRRASQAFALLLALLLLPALGAGCSGSRPGGAGPVTLQIAGSSSMRPVLDELALAYQASHANVQFDIRGGGSTLGLEELQKGSADIAAVSWRAEDATDPKDVRPTPIARDGIVLVVHPSNKTAGLTLLQLRALYRGETLDWAELGGPPGEPLIISREDGSGDRNAFEALVMGDDRVTLDALVMPTAEAVADYVTQHPAAIGYASLAQERDDLRILPVEGVTPSAEQVDAGTYHLGRLLYLYVKISPSAEVRSFLDFVRSPAGQAIVARHHAAL